MRKKHRPREPNGRLSRHVDEKEFPPTTIRRARDAALRKYGDKRWGTELGRLYLIGKITNTHLAAGERWAAMVCKYHSAIDAPAPNAKAGNLQNGRHGQAPDPDSLRGQMLADTESGVVRRLRRAHYALAAAGLNCENAVKSVCEMDETVGYLLHQSLRDGLDALAKHWHLTEEARYVR